MSQLVGRILLAMLLFPLAAVLYMLVVVVGMESVRHTLGGWSTNTREFVFVSAGVATAVFIAVYWCALWFRAVRWTTARQLMTIGAGVGAAMAGVVVGVALAVVAETDGTFNAFIGTVIAPLLWLVATIFIWRETAGERKERLAGAREAVVCPTCGYNLTGLRGTRCPECGSEYTLDELMRGQPGKVAAELE